MSKAARAALVRELRDAFAASSQQRGGAGFVIGWLIAAATDDKATRAELYEAFHDALAKEAA